MRKVPNRRVSSSPFPNATLSSVARRLAFAVGHARKRDPRSAHDGFVPRGIYRIPSMITTNNGTLIVFAQASYMAP